MSSKLVQGSLATVLAAAAIAILIWATKVFVESVLLVSSVIAVIPGRVETSAARVGVHFLGLVIVVALAAGAYLLLDRLRSQIDKQAQKESSED